MAGSPEGRISKEGLTRGGYRFVVIWVLGIIVLYGLGGYFGVRQLQGYKTQTREYRQAWMKTFTAAGQETPAPEIRVVPYRGPVHISCPCAVCHLSLHNGHGGQTAAIADFRHGFLCSTVHRVCRC